MIDIIHVPGLSPAGKVMPLAQTNTVHTITGSYFQEGERYMRILFPDSSRERFSNNRQVLKIGVSLLEFICYLIH